MLDGGRKVTNISLEQPGNTHENGHAKTWTQVVGVTQDTSEFGELDVFAIAGEEACRNERQSVDPIRGRS